MRREETVIRCILKHKFHENWTHDIYTISHRIDTISCARKDRERERKRDVARRSHEQLMIGDNAKSIDIDPYKKKNKKEKKMKRKKKRRRKKKRKKENGV